MIPEGTSPINGSNVQITLSTILADQAVLQQQIEAMDSFDAGFDELSFEIQENYVVVNELLLPVMEYAGQHNGSKELWVQIAEALENAKQLAGRLAEKIQLANAVRGRGRD